MFPTKDSLLTRVRSREARVGVVGLGHVGLPLAIAFAEGGSLVTGIDIDPTRVNLLNGGRSPFRHIPSEPIAGVVDAGTLKCTTEFTRASELDCVLIAVPTPLTRARDPDMSHIVDTGCALAPGVRREQLYVLESATWPGTTEEVLKPILEKGGLMAGVDFYLAAAPERVDPAGGHALKATPKVIGGYTPACAEIARALYEAVVPRVVQVSTTRVAEMSKLVENVFRSVNVALVNEMKMLCDRMGMDVWEVIEAAATKGYGFLTFYPGPGLGGHPLAIDPFYLSWKAREFDFQARFVEMAGAINTSMPRYVVARTTEALSGAQKALNGSRLLVLGVTTEKDVDDVRGSPAIRIIELLQERGARVAYHDDMVPSLAATGATDLSLSSALLTEDLVASADAVLVLTAHESVDYEWVVAKAKLVVDTRGVTRGMLGAVEKVFRA